MSSPHWLRIFFTRSLTLASGVLATVALRQVVEQRAQSKELRV